MFLVRPVRSLSLTPTPFSSSPQITGTEPGVTIVTSTLHKTKTDVGPSSRPKDLPNLSSNTLYVFVVPFKVYKTGLMDLSTSTEIDSTLSDVYLY